MKFEEEIAQKEFNNEHQKAMLNIYFTSAWMNNHRKEYFKQFDITFQQYNILRILRGQNPKPSTVNLLKERMIEKMSDTSRLVDRLQLKGLITRKSNTTDKRAVDIFISERGLSLLAEVDKTIHNLESTLRNLSVEEAQTLNFLLDKIRISK